METAPGYQLLLTSRVHEARIEKVLERHGLTRAEYTVLYAIERGQRAPADIVGFLDVQPEAVKKTVEDLIARGHAERNEIADDGIQVTDRGHTALSNGIAAAVDANAKIRSALSPAEQETFVKLMERIRGGEKVLRATI